VALLKPNGVFPNARGGGQDSGEETPEDGQRHGPSKWEENGILAGLRG